MTTLTAINPRSGRADYHFSASTGEEVSATAARLRAAQSAWSDDLKQRMQAMAHWAEALSAHRDSITAALQADTGRRFMSRIELDSMIERVHYWREHAPRLLASSGEQHSRCNPAVAYRHQLVPYPLVGVISPWNFPLTLSLVDSIPALFAGAAVLLKPSEITPRFAAALADSIADVPALNAVFAIVRGGAETGTALVDSVDMVCSTDSVATGRRVAVRAAENFIPACLELGGKDPAIVLEDADLTVARDALMRSAAGSCGQACMSIERIYAHERVFDALRDGLVAQAAQLRFNAEDPHAGALPPFIDPRQAGKVAAQLEDALAKGAQMHCGGPPVNIDGGWWMAPTVLTGIRDDMLLMREETFGPLLPLIPFCSDDEAVAMANDSEFGLSGSVFGEEAHAIAVASRMNVGAVGINDASMTALIHDIEKQSFRFSGMGPSRMGDSGLLRFLRTRALMIQRAPAAPLSVLDEANLPT
jgi:acyl-CoA reductase-like NAD-dependent aldehyde dehydrogenase